MTRSIPQMAPWFGDEEKRAVADYLDSGGWLMEFKKTREFEDAIARFTGAKHAVVVSNGTVSLTLALLAKGVRPGDEVLVPDYTMIASPNSVVPTGATPVLVDVDPANQCLDLAAAERAITPRTKAVMYVSINGRSHDMAEVARFARQHGLALVEDAAQSLGSRSAGRHLGTLGDVGSFSFSVPKIITTGQGGALVTDDPAVDRELRLLKDFGRRKAGVDLHDVVGWNFKFTDLQAVIGLEQMKKLPWRVERKKEIFGLYRDLLAGVDGVEVPATDLRDVSPWFIDVLVEPGRREKLVEHLKAAGVGSRPFYPAVHTQPPYAHAKGAFPGADRVSARGLWLPSSSQLTDDDVRYVCDAVRKFSA